MFAFFTLRLFLNVLGANQLEQNQFAVVAQPSFCQVNNSRISAFPVQIPRTSSLNNLPIIVPLRTCWPSSSLNMLRSPNCEIACRLAANVPFLASVISFSAKPLTSFAFRIVVEIVSCSKALPPDCDATLCDASLFDLIVCLRLCDA